MGEIIHPSTIPSQLDDFDPYSHRLRLYRRTPEFTALGQGTALGASSNTLWIEDAWRQPPDSTRETHQHNVHNNTTPSQYTDTSVFPTSGLEPISSNYCLLLHAHRVAEFSMFSVWGLPWRLPKRSSVSRSATPGRTGPTAGDRDEDEDTVKFRRRMAGSTQRAAKSPSFTGDEGHSHRSSPVNMVMKWWDFHCFTYLFVTGSKNFNEFLKFCSIKVSGFCKEHMLGKVCLVGTRGTQTASSQGYLILQDFWFTETPWNRACPTPDFGLQSYTIHQQMQPDATSKMRKQKNGR